MARRSDLEMLQLRERWKELLWREEFYNGTPDEQGKILGVSGETIRNWRSGMSLEFWQKYVDSFKEKLQPEFAAIMMAQIREAKKGNVSSAEFVFKRAEGWSPKQTNENINRNPELEGLSDEDLKNLVVKDMSREELLKALEGKKAPSDVVGGTSDEKAISG
jgi:hypothetical protein